jgi:hypothetical protein
MITDREFEAQIDEVNRVEDAKQIEMVKIFFNWLAMVVIVFVCTLFFAALLVTPEHGDMGRNAMKFWSDVLGVQL